MSQNLLQNLFKFPALMVDADMYDQKEKRNQLLALEEDTDLDIIRCEVECPYFDFVSIADRWIPTAESRDNAKAGVFNHCFVVFGTSGSYTVPWSKEKFKKELVKFAERLPPKVTVIVPKNEQ